MTRPFRKILEIKNAEPKGFVAVLECGHEKYDTSQKRFGTFVRCDSCGHRWSRVAAACLGCGRTDRSYAVNGLCYLCDQHRWPPIRYGSHLVGKTRKYPINDRIFDSWTEKSAYLYGVLFSDGSIDRSGRRNTISIILSDRDRVWLNDLREAFGHEGSVYTRKIPTGHSVGISMSSVHAISVLIRLGLKKSCPDTMPDDLVRHFVRGMWDGDGCVYFASQNKAYHSNLTGAHFILDWIADKLHAMAGTKRAVLHPKGNAAQSYSIAYANADTGRLADYLYQDATTWLERKHKLFLLAKQGYRKLCRT